MASKQATVDFITDQITNAGVITSRKMFGEYALYCDTKVVAFVCDDQLFVKPTAAGRKFIGDVTEAPAYPGSKMYFLIDGDKWEDREWLTELIQRTTDALPLPKPKKSKRK
ncbi:MAG: TfoX/Sxy family protein [Candidatus Levyibacteriota bacterium]